MTADFDDTPTKHEQERLVVAIDEQGNKKREGQPTYNTIASPVPKTDSRNDSEFLGIPIPLMVVCLCIVGFLACLDLSICFTVMPQIGTEFKQYNISTWIHSSFSLSSLIATPISSRLSDIFGRKPVLITITVLFLAGSVGCSFSQSLLQLAVFRGLAGLGGGGLMIMSNVVTHDIVPLKQRGRYQSYVIAISMLGTAFGSPIGGFLTDWLGWRYCFKINIIPLIFCLCVWVFFMKNYTLPTTSMGDSDFDRVKSIDFGGSFICSVATGSLCTALIFGGNTREWSDPLILSMLALAVCSFISLGLWETHVPRNPLMPPRVLANRNVGIACAGVIMDSAVYGGANVALPQFFMGVLGFSTTKTGLYVMVYTLGVVLGSLIAGRCMRISSSWFRNMAVAIASTLCFGCVFMHFWMLQKVPFLVGIGLWTAVGCTNGVFFVSVNMVVPTSVPKSDMAATFSLLNMSRNVGYMAGVAAASSVTQTCLKTLLHERLNGPDAEHLIWFIRTSLRDVHTLSPEVQAIVADVLGISLSNAYILLAVFAFVSMATFSWIDSKRQQVS